MREIIISTETGSDIPSEMAEKYNIHVVPMHVIIDGVDYLDGPDFPMEKIYGYYESTKKVPTTAAVNVDEYQTFFTKIQEDHPDCVIIHFSYSSNASGSYQNAQIAVQDFKDIYLVDTKMVTGGCAAHIFAAMDLICQKADTITDYRVLVDEIVTITPRIACAFIPGNLDFLKAGGRVSNAAYLGATILQLKPLIEIDESGTLIASKKYQGSMKKIADRFTREFITNHDLDRETIYLMHTPDTSPDVLDKIRAAALDLGFKECIDIPTSGAITSNSGPGSVGLAGISAQKEATA